MKWVFQQKSKLFLEEWLNNVGGEVTARNIGWILLTFLILLEAMFNFIRVLVFSMVKWLPSIVRQFLDLNAILRQFNVNCTSIPRQFNVNCTSISNLCIFCCRQFHVNYTSITRQLYVNFTSIIFLVPNWCRIGSDLESICFIGLHLTVTFTWNTPQLLSSAA